MATDNRSTPSGVPTDSDRAPASPPHTPLPVTVLSGFLGSGKTTLLKHILSAAHGLRIAVIVNDMAELNIDASLVKNAGLVQTSEQMVQMQNGCICCTLRADLLKEVARLAATGAFDYCVIESTGISEPMQVAETFTMAVEEGWEAVLAAAENNNQEQDQNQDQDQDHDHDHDHGHGHGDRAAPRADNTLHAIARLDTCVTVVDASSMSTVLADTRSVGDTEDNAAPEDERSLAELLIDQIEFANVILLNKTDVVSAAKVKECTGLLTAMNPGARIIPTCYSRVDLNAILNTNRFNMDEACAAPGWLKSMREELRPESEEYGISSFVYRRRRPFHPKRLFELVDPLYLLQQYEFGADEGDEEEDRATQQQEQEQEAGAGDEAMDTDDDGRLTEISAATYAKNREASALAGIVRSKGFVWLAHGNDVMGNWSQAGAILTVTPESPWLCLMPQEFLDSMDSDAVRNEMVGEHGDRRQEIVFIGRPDRAAIEDALDKCLVTDAEWAAASYPEPGFEAWPDAKEYLQSEGEDEEMTVVEGV